MINSGKANEIKERNETGSTMKFKRHMMMYNTQFVGTSTTKKGFFNDFSTLYSMVFYLSPTILEKTNVWMVQDESAMKELATTKLYSAAGVITTDS